MLLVACAPARPERAYVVSSEPSYYSPVARLAISVDTAADSVIVAIDSGTIRAQGFVAHAPNAVMRNIVLDALIASRAEKNSSGTPLINPWITRAASQPVKVADSLLFNIAVPLPSLRLSILRPPQSDLREEWLIFRITGDAITDEIRLENGSVVPASVRHGGVRVFACSERNLAGTLDSERAKRLATEYASVC